MGGLDLVLRGGLVVDGTGAAGRLADVGIAGERIAAVGEGLVGRRSLDCRDRVVAPGFIDTHSHSDLRVLVEPGLPMKLRQGVTLEVLGQDGISVAPVAEGDRAETARALAGLLGPIEPERWRWRSVAEYLAALDAARPALDLAYLVPHGTLRTFVLGREERRPTDEELSRLRAELARGLDEGALGLSTGLIYPPCCYADTEELVALGATLALRRAPFVAHVRSEADGVESAVEEMIAVGRRSGCPIHLSHFKIAGRRNFARAPALLARIDAARRAGVAVTGDQYPYAAGSTLLGAILPPWAHRGGPAATLRRLADPAARRKIREEILREGPSTWDSFWQWTGPEGIVVADVPSGRRPELLGKTLAEAARAAGRDPLDFALDLLLEEEMGVGMISHSQSEELVERFLALPFLNGGSDALLGGRPHPRAYGTFPRFLRLAREKGLVSLPEIVRKLTSQAARAMGLDGVGEIRPGWRASLVVFDPERVRDRATFDEPTRYPEGIDTVVVRGRVAVEAGEPTGERAGRVVRSREEER